MTAWFFLLAVYSATVVGPFKDKAACEAAAKYAGSGNRGTVLVECWEGPAPMTFASGAPSNMTLTVPR